MNQVKIQKKDWNTNNEIKNQKCIKFPLLANNMFKTYLSKEWNFFENQQSIKNKWYLTR